MKYLKYFLAAIFLFGAVVQYNDPDPLLWMVVYGIAAAACVYSAIKPEAFRVSLVVGLVTAVWAVLLAPGVLGKIPFGDMFGAWEMRNEGIEQSREMYGLVVIAIVMLGLAFAGYRQKRASSQ